MEPLMLAVLLAVVFFANFYASAVGSASLLILPVMFFTGMPANVAIATNRLHRVFATGASGIKYLRNVKVDLKDALLYLTVSSVGAILGAFIVINLEKSFLKLFVSLTLLAMAIFFFVKKDLGLKEQKGKKSKQNLVLSSFILFGIALYRSVVGSSAGTFLRIYFILREKFSFLQAATYNSLIATIGNIFATLVFIFAGIIDYWIALYMILVGVAAAYLGAHFSIKKGNDFVRKLFLLVVILTSLKLIADVLFGF
jgi:uncharacterized membrane protein YfcA